MNKILKLSKDHNLHIVEDAAHACGASYNGKRIGSHSEFVCFSFHPVKNLAMPTGGAITINSNQNQTSALKSKRWCGISNRKDSLYDISDLGWNYYMNEISATIGLVQLSRLDQMNKKRLEIAKNYNNNLTIENKIPLKENCVFHIYWIRVKNRTEFMKKMKEQKIETGIHYKPVHLMKYYRNSEKLDTSEKIWKELVSIPMHPNLTDENIDYIIKNVNTYAK